MDKLKLKRLYSLKKKLIKRYLQWHLKLLRFSKWTGNREF